MQDVLFHVYKKTWAAAEWSCYVYNIYFAFQTSSLVVLFLKYYTSTAKDHAAAAIEYRATTTIFLIAF